MKNIILILAVLFISFQVYGNGLESSTPTYSYSYTVIGSTFTGSQSVQNIISQDETGDIVANIVDTVSSTGRAIKLRQMFQFAQSFTTFSATTDEYLNLSNGHLLQWGQAECGIGGTEVSFPVAFTKAPEPVAVQVLGTNTPAVSQTTAHKFSVTCAEMVTVFWLAAGR